MCVCVCVCVVCVCVVCVCVCGVCVCVCVCVCDSTSFILCGTFGSPYLDKATAAAKAAQPTLTSVCSTFVCPNTGMAGSVLPFF